MALASSDKRWLAERKWRVIWQQRRVAWKRLEPGSADSSNKDFAFHKLAKLLRKQLFSVSHRWWILGMSRLADCTRHRYWQWRDITFILERIVYSNMASWWSGVHVAGFLLCNWPVLRVSSSMIMCARRPPLLLMLLKPHNLDQAQLDWHLLFRSLGLLQLISRLDCSPLCSDSSAD